MGSGFILELHKINWSLYAILDKKFLGDRPVEAVAEQVIAGGAGVIQLRNKHSHVREFYSDALAAKKITQAHGVPLIINDRVDVAQAVDADGVHLGHHDLPFAVARKLIGETMILGASVHNLQELRIAEQGGADYLGVGTVYPTTTKNHLQAQGPNIVKQIRAHTSLPIVGIGGISVDNLEAVIAAGANGVAVISDLLTATDIKSRAGLFIEKIKYVSEANFNNQ